MTIFGFSQASSRPAVRLLLPVDWPSAERPPWLALLHAVSTEASTETGKVTHAVLCEVQSICVYLL